MTYIENQPEIGERRQSVDESERFLSYSDQNG